MKQSNFADTYTVNAVDGGVAGGPPTNIRGGSVRGNVVVGQPPRGKKTVASDTRVRKAVHEGTKQHTSTPNTHSTSSRRTAKTTSSNYERFSGDADYDRMDNDIETDSLDSYSRDYVMEKPKRKTVMRCLCVCVCVCVCVRACTYFHVCLSHVLYIHSMYFCVLFISF